MGRGYQYNVGNNIEITITPRRSLVTRGCKNQLSPYLTHLPISIGHYGGMGQYYQLTNWREGGGNTFLMDAWHRRLGRWVGGWFAGKTGMYVPFLGSEYWQFIS